MLTRNADLHGKFAALKLQKISDLFPGRVFFRAEFTKMPDCVFGGAEFALIPSRDEPFGLVAVEFGRKGALGVGARVGGLGQMPGFWYTIESISPQHLLAQFRKAINAALRSTLEERTSMRAWSSKQRFPVAEWVRRLNTLYDESIRIHKQETKRQLKRPLSIASSIAALGKPRFLSRSPSTPAIRANSRDSISVTGPDMEPTSGSPPGASTPALRLPFLDGDDSSGHTSPSLISLHGPPNIGGDDFLAPTPPFARSANSSQRNSTVSLQDVVGERHDLKLQHVDASFTDSTGGYYTRYEESLEGLTADNSQGDLCIADFLKCSEKEWFGKYRDAKLGRHHFSTPTGTSTPDRHDSHSDSIRGAVSHDTRGDSVPRSEKSSHPMVIEDEFLLGSEYRPPTGLRR